MYSENVAGIRKDGMRAQGTELEAVHLYIITSKLFATPAADQRGSFTVYILCDFGVL